MIPDATKRNGLVPDYYDDPTLRTGDHLILPSFKDIRRNTLQALYGIEDEKDTSTEINLDLLMDKSPKGSVDEAIRSLVDLINAHPSYATLSSCSGRISLFDPNHGGDLDNKNNMFKSEKALDGNDDSKDSKEVDTDLNTGKGYGSWLITSHATISPNYLIEVLDEHAKISSGHALMFKHEPLLLHIAACNMSRARQLLTIACNLGFRESGLVVTPKRITVAIRSHSLSLAVPISSSGKLRPNNEYLSELVREANNRFHLNAEKLITLEREVMNELFTMNGESISNACDVNEESYFLTGNTLPDLNLWGHSAVCIHDATSSEYDTEILVLGGYGGGPNKGYSNESKNYGCSRSDKVYSLKIKDDILHVYNNNAWQEICQDKNEEEVTDIVHGMKMKRTTFTAREGHASCILPLDKIIETSLQSDNFIATFGGRASPARPKDELILMSSKTRPLQFYNPVDVRGVCPPARWGHSFIALSGVGGKIAAVIGGRDETNVFDSIYTLSCIPETAQNDSCSFHFAWDKIVISDSIPRFHHSSVLIESESHIEQREHKIIVFGGLTSLQLFDDKDSDESLKAIGQVITIRSDNRAHVEILENTSLLCIGASSCSLLVNNSSSESENTSIVRIGGLCSDLNNENHQDFNLIDTTTDCTDIPCIIDDDIDFGSMVHHVVLNQSCIHKGPNFFSIGGGIPSFAFGQSFAKSYAFSIQSGITTSSRDCKVNTIRNVTNEHHIKKSSAAKTPKMKANGEKSNMTDIVYVVNRKAKELKQKLQSLNFLDRNYRMTKADQNSALRVNNVNGMIAVPVTRSCLDYISTSQEDEKNEVEWIGLIEGIGTQDMPYSTVVMGRK